MRREQLNRRIQQTSAAAKAERLQSPQIIQRGKAVRAGGGGGRIAYCKTSFADLTTATEAPFYLDADVLPWDEETTYAADDWCEVAGVEYKSLQDDNLDHAVTDEEWWEEGTVSVTVKCNISNGTYLSDVVPWLVDGDPVYIVKAAGDWYIPTQFNGAAVRA